MPSRGPRKWWNYYGNPAFWGVPNAKRGNKIRRGYLNAAFSGGQKRAEVLRNPCILEGPQRQAPGQNQKWTPHPSLLGGPQEGGIAAYPLHSWWTPMLSEETKIKRGYLHRAFSGAHKRAKMLRNPCILGGPQRQALEKSQKWRPHLCLLGSLEEGGIAR